MVSKLAVLRTAIPKALRDWVDNRLISAHIRIVRAFLLGTLFNSAAIIIGLWGDANPEQLALFGSSTLAACLHRLWLAEGIGRGRRRRRNKKIARAFWLNSLWLGLTIACPLATWFPSLPATGQLLLGTAGIVQIAAAAYMIRTLVSSATVYIALQAIGLSIGLLRLGDLASVIAVSVLVTASVLMIRMTYTARDLFVTRILSDRDLAASTRTVKLLLNEYEENGSDWLFELNRNGKLVGVSRRFAEAAGGTVTALEGIVFTSLFTADAARSSLAKAIAERQALRELVVTLGGIGTGKARWWSVSGRRCQIGGNVVYRGVISDITEQRQAEFRAQQMANFDALTGLPNRVQFNTALEAMIAAREDDDQIALLMLDLDHFKTINDVHGHPLGDAFLRATAQRLQDCVQKSGLGGSQPLIARHGGDEFAVIVCGSNACDHAVRLTELLRVELDEPMHIDGHELHSTVSIGIALAPFHADSTKQLQSYAGIALNAAKTNGRGNWEMFEPGMDSQLHERHMLARDLRHAVSRGELRLFIQPLVDVASEAKTGYEALLRWQHPTRGLVAPDQFIPIAEETGLIVPIGEWVIRTAFAEAASWTGGETIAINLSPVQFGSANLLPTIVNALAENGLDPGRVEFEITEGVLLQNSEANIVVLNRLHSFGVKIALDDFGTGYASLNYLLTFPFDKIKIDRRFVSELATREESRAIVSAVIALANQLGMCTLAEGVEEREQLDRLRQDGCRMVQGWLFGKALPSDEYHPQRLRPAKPRKNARTQTYSGRRAA